MIRNCIRGGQDRATIDATYAIRLQSTVWWHYPVSTLYTISNPAFDDTRMLCVPQIPLFLLYPTHRLNLIRPHVSIRISLPWWRAGDMMRGLIWDTRIVQGRSLISPMRVQFGHGVKTAACVQPCPPLLPDELGNFHPALWPVLLQPASPPIYLLVLLVLLHHLTFLLSQQPCSKSSDMFCTPLLFYCLSYGSALLELFRTALCSAHRSMFSEGWWMLWAG